MPVHEVSGSIAVAGPRSNVRASGKRPSLRRAAVLMVCLAVSMSLSGCGLWRKITGEERRDQEAAAKVQEMRQRCERYADAYVGKILESVDAILDMTSDPRVYDRLTAWQLGQVNAAYTIATGESPLACSLDFVVLATLSRDVVQKLVNPDQGGGEAPLVKLYRDLEDEAWDNAAKVFTTEQLDELRQIIADWLERNPDVKLVGFVRFGDFASAAGWAAQSSSHGSLLSLIGIDPLEGLDPAVRQIEQSRLLAERAIFYMQRLPYLVDIQAQRAIAQAVIAPGVEGLLENLDQASGAMETYAVVAQGLPGDFARERDALIRQLSGEFLEQQAELRAVLVDLQGTLQSGSETALAIDAAVQSIDHLMARFPQSDQRGEGGPGKPFDINEYTAAATEFTRTAQQLTGLIEVLGRESSQVAGLVEDSVAQGQTLVDYLFKRALVLIVLLLVGLLAAALAYRWLAPKVARRPVD